jgi:hypothetical protein
MKPLHHSSGCFEVFLNAQKGKMPKTFYIDQVSKMGKGEVFPEACMAWIMHLSYNAKCCQTSALREG